MQTLHQQPIPYTPDVRVGSARDNMLFQIYLIRWYFRRARLSLKSTKSFDAELWSHRITQ